MLIRERNWVFALNSNFIIAIIFQSDISSLDYWSHRISSLKYQKTTTPNCKDIGITKFEFLPNSIPSKNYTNYFSGVSAILPVKAASAHLKEMK